MFYNNVLRNRMRLKFPDMKLCEMSKLIAEKWHKAKDKEKAPYMNESNKDKVRYGKAMIKFNKDREKYMKFMRLNYPDEPIPWLKLKGNKKSKKHNKVVQIKLSNLVNKVVRVSFTNAREITGWKYYFVLTYIPDLQWCRLAPMTMTGTFNNEKNGIAKGRLRWKLVQEGKALEVDISAKRCMVVRTRVMKHTPVADEEEWDILDDNHYAPCAKFDVGGNMYKSVAQTLLGPLLTKFKNVTVSSSPHSDGMDLDDDGDEEEGEDDEEDEEDEEHHATNDKKRKTNNASPKKKKKARLLQ